MGKTKEIFVEKRIVKGKGIKALEIFDLICPDFTVFADAKPSEYVKEVWAAFKSGVGEIKNNSINGKIFEHILSSLLINENLLPFYAQAKVAFVPNADYDFLLYCDEKGPIVLSAKTSLRERYKQADLEAIALKYVYRKSESYLIAMDKDEAGHIQKKVRSGDVIGIDKVIYAASDEFDEFIGYLKSHEFKKAGSVKIVNSGIVVE